MRDELVRKDRRSYQYPGHRTLRSLLPRCCEHLLFFASCILVLQPLNLPAQSTSSGVKVNSPENVNPPAPSCDGYPVGYTTAPAPVPATCLDFVKECALTEGIASWITRNVYPTSSRVCKPPAGSGACQVYRCVVGTPDCRAFGAPASCTPSADGCTTYGCDPSNPGTCNVTGVKDPNTCKITWEDQVAECGNKTIYRTVKAISDLCCVRKVGDTEATDRLSPPCQDDQSPACTLTVSRLGDTGQCSVTVQSTAGAVDNLKLSKQALIEQQKTSAELTFTAESRSMTSVVVRNLTAGSSVSAALVITAIGGDSISNKWEDKKYGVCNWDGSRCYSWDFPHGGALSCSDHATCKGTLTVAGGQTQQADYGSLVNMNKSYYGVQALNQNTKGAGTTISVMVTSTEALAARVEVTVKSFDDFTDTLVEQQKVVDLSGVPTTLVDDARKWSGPTSESFTQPCPIGETSSFDAEVRYNGKIATCSQSVTSLPPDACGRNPRTDTLAPNPHYGSRDCCDGVELPDEFMAYDKLTFKVQESLGKRAYKDGTLYWMCKRNSGAVTVANPNALYNLAFLGWTNTLKISLEENLENAFDPNSTAGGAHDGKAANSCFACGQIRTEGGCFPPGVLIATGDGSTTKRVEEIVAGDLVWNPVLKRSFKVVTISEGREKKDLVVVRAGAQTLRMTTEHPVLTTRGMKQAIELVRGDTVIDSSGREVMIEAITRDPAVPGLSVINFILQQTGDAHDGLLIADGLVVGDLTIQRRLAADATKPK